MEFQSKMNDLIDKLPFATRNTMFEDISRFGWVVGGHTYGTPKVLEPEYSSLTIGLFCSIAQDVTIVLANHRIDTVSSYPFRSLWGLWPGAENAGPDHDAKDGVIIGSDVWIGCGAVILPGTKIADGCVIGANAVVRGTFPPYSIIAGNPAKVVRQRFEPNIVNELMKISWWNWDENQIISAMPYLASGDPIEFINWCRSGGLLADE